MKTSVVDATKEESISAFFDSVAPQSFHHLVVTLGPSAECSSILGRAGLAGLRLQFDLKFFGQLAPVSLGAEKIADGGSIVLCSGALSRRPGVGNTALMLLSK